MDKTSLDDFVKTIGFTGTRHGMTDLQAVMFEGLCSGIDVFRHGSCKGSDVQAARIVRRTHIKPVHIIAHPGPEVDDCRELSGVDNEVLPGKTHFARNRDIVFYSDHIIATPADMEEQKFGGTWYTIKYAVKMDKPVTIIWPDGSLEAR